MRTSKLPILVLGCLLASTASAMNNADLIKLQKSGLSDETILLAMAREPAAFDTTAEALVELKEAGISEEIIKKVLDLAASGKVVVAPSPSPATETAAPEVISPSPALVSQIFESDMPSVAPPFVSPVVGGDYYTRFTFHEEGNKHVSTNYARGALVPINTQVKLVSLHKDELVLKRLDTGEEIKVENVEKYTHKPLTELARLMLSTDKTPLEQLPDAVAAAIRNGEMRKGMTKEQVIMARGYPPAHETPSSESDRWVYWSSRFVKHTVVFANGRLVDGRGIY
jgi:hypothetical protein